MKNLKGRLNIFLLILGVLLINSSIDVVHAQDVKKNKVRLNAQYVKVMEGESYLELKASSKVNKQNVKVSNEELILYNIIDDKKIKLGTVNTNMEGKAKFIFEGKNALQADSTHTYTIKVLYKGNDSYKKAAKTINFKDVDIIAKLIVKDSINYIEARLSETSTDSLLSGISLKVQLQRLFRPLLVGEEFNETDSDGTIIVPIEEEYPGVDGNLIFEVVLDESDDYGTVKALVNAPIGIPIVDESNFDKRTMWATRDKTPIFLLIFPNILILGMWGIIIYLILNLFKISNSKNLKT